MHTLDQKLQADIICLNPEYWVFSPKNHSDKKLPLLIYLHGSGGRGNDIGKVRGQAMQLWRGIGKFDKDPCIVVAPQCLNSKAGGKNGTWNPADLNILLKHLKATLPIDCHRIYLTGNSMGGYAFAGAKDKVVPPDRSERMLAAIQKAGGKEARLKVYPEEGHGVGRAVFSTSALYGWMFSKAREEAAAPTSTEHSSASQTKPALQASPASL